jgi:DNA-binding NtrC family response regulator
LPVDGYSVPTLRDAREILARQSFGVVFCEERLPDGLYGDLLAEVRLDKRDTRFVVMLCVGEWEEYLNALRLGASEVLRCPLHPTDVDLAMIHAMKGPFLKEMTAHA